MADVEELFRQVDEELEAEKLHKLWLRYRPWLVGGLVLLFTGLFAYVGWQNYRHAQDRSASRLYMAAEAAAGGGQWEQVPDKVAPLMADHAGHGYQRLGRLLLVRSLVAKGEKEQALKELEGMADQSGDDLAIRDLALLNAAYLTATEPARARGYLGRIQAASAYRPLATELLGLLAAQEGDRAAALAFYQEGLKVRPGGALEERLRRRVESLGSAVAPPSTPAPPVGSPPQ